MIRKMLILAMCFALTGCLLSIDSDRRYTESSWDRHETDRIVVGSTTGVWVTNTFGRPYSRVEYENGRELWKYRNRGERDTEVALFLIFSVNTKSEHLEILTIELEGGVVTDYWIEDTRH